MLEENRNLENPYSKKRTILKWIFIGLGVFFIVIGVLAPIILLMMAGGQGWWLPLIFGVLQEYTTAFVGLGIILIIIGGIIKKPTLRKKIILIIFIILSFPFIFRATVGTIVGYSSINKNTVARDGITEVSEERLKEVTDKALALENPNECKKLLPFYFFPPFLASRLLPSFWNPYPNVSITKTSWSIGPLYHIYVEKFTECVSEIAKKKRDVKICEEFGPFIEEGLPGWSLSYPFDREECESKVSAYIFPPIIEEAIKTNDAKNCSKITKPCWFNDCVYRVAVNMEDVQLCEMIKKEEKCSINYYESCYQEISPELVPEHMWGTYSNEAYGYKIDYPVFWNWTGGSGSYCPGVSKDCWHISFFSYAGKEVSPEIYIYNPAPDAITVKKYNPFGSAVPNILEIESNMKLIKTEKEKVKDSEYYFEKLFYVPQEGVEKESIILVKWVAGSFEHSGAIVIYYKDETDKNLKIFNQMLSTFRFIE
jgi:hypothetical protein